MSKRYFLVAHTGFLLGRKRLVDDGDYGDRVGEIPEQDEEVLVIGTMWRS
jgi:hypothetical protein